MELRVFPRTEYWGQEASRGLAGRLASENNGKKWPLHGLVSEVRAGTDRRARCTLKFYQTRSLKSTLISNPKGLGEAEGQGWGSLPYIFSVISVGEPTELRLSPSEAELKRLRKSCPQAFQDSIPREEVLISVGYSLLSIGVKASDKIKMVLKTFPEMTCFIPVESMEKLFRAEEPDLKELFYWLLRSDEQQRRTAIEIIMNRVKNKGHYSPKAMEYMLFSKIHKLFPNNVAVFFPFFFKIGLLYPGDAVHIAPGTPYALIYGDFICISTKSYNTLELGMTAKDDDVGIFLDIADLSYRPINKYLVQRQNLDLSSVRYNPVGSLLAIDRISLPKGIGYTLPAYETSSILCIVTGAIMTKELKILKMGTFLFLSANEDLTLRTKEDTTIYRSFVNPLSSILDEI